IKGQLTAPQLDRLAAELFGDPVAQTSARRSVGGGGVASLNGQAARDGSRHIVETALWPGVTDPVADQIVRCAALLGFTGVQRAATGRRYELHGALSEAEVDFLARRLLSNLVI